jgi:hypothetical protein
MKKIVLSILLRIFAAIALYLTVVGAHVAFATAIAVLTYRALK